MIKNHIPLLNKIHNIIKDYEDIKKTILPELPQIEYSWDVEGRYFNKKENIPIRLKKHKNYTSNNKYLFCSRYRILLDYTNIFYIQIHKFQKGAQKK